jgi:hypothetical protein
MDSPTAANATIFGAFKTLSTGTPIFRAIGNPTEIYGGSSGDGYTAAEKWTHLSGGISVLTQANKDVSILVGTTIPTLLPNKPVEVAFATIGANNLTQLNNAADAAQLLWNSKLVPNDREENPSGFAMHRSFPNPFNQSTQIGYDLGTTSAVKMEVFNLLGQRVRTLVAETQNAGSYKQIWDGRDDSGAQLPSGTYFCRLKAGSFIANKTLTLLR